MYLLIVHLKNDKVNKYFIIITKNKKNNSLKGWKKNINVVKFWNVFVNLEEIEIIKKNKIILIN